MTKITQFQAIHVDEQNNVSIAAAGDTSSSFDCGGTQLCGFYAGEELSGLTVTFMVRNKPEDVAASLYDGSSTPVLVNYVMPVITPGTFVYTPVSISIFSGIRYVQLVVSAPVAQDALVQLAVRPT